MLIFTFCYKSQGEYSSLGWRINFLNVFFFLYVGIKNTDLFLGFYHLLLSPCIMILNKSSMFFFCLIYDCSFLIISLLFPCLRSLILISSIQILQLNFAFYILQLSLLGQRANNSALSKGTFERRCFSFSLPDAMSSFFF